MLQIPVTQDPFQEQTFEFEGIKIRLTLRLVCGVPLLYRTTQSYFFWVEDESGAHLDPMAIEDLGTRCFLYIGAKDEAIRTTMES